MISSHFSSSSQILLHPALLHHVKDGRKYVRQPYDADDVLPAGDQQRLVVADDKLMNGLVERRILGDEFTLTGDAHEFRDRIFSRFAAQVSKRVVEERVVLEHAFYESFGKTDGMQAPSFQNFVVLGLQRAQHINLADFADDSTVFVQNQNGPVPVMRVLVTVFFLGFLKSHDGIVKSGVIADRGIFGKRHQQVGYF